MNNVTEITCFIASPGDTSEERSACECVFEEINHGIGRIKGFRLVPLRWEKMCIQVLQSMVSRLLIDRWMAITTCLLEL